MWTDRGGGTPSPPSFIPHLRAYFTLSCLPIRLLETFSGRCYKVLSDEPDGRMEDVSDNYWSLRAEEVPLEEEGRAPEGMRDIQACHFN